MAQSFQHMVAEAREASQIVSPEHAFEAAKHGDIILDVREPEELQSAGRVHEAVHIPRGLLEARAEQHAANANPHLLNVRDRGTVHILCASGARAALAAVTLTKMGYRASIIEDGLAGWKSANLPIEG